MRSKPKAALYTAFLLLSSFHLGYFAVAQTSVVLPEDEFILPPLLHAYLGSDVVNVNTLQNKKRQAVANEWLDYGDSFDLAAPKAVQVLQCETIQWVGGGVFDGKIGDRKWSREEPPYEVFLQRGWMHVWIKPDELHHAIKINTGNQSLLAEDAQFWANTHAGVTELYLIQGEVKDAEGHAFHEKDFVTWEGKGKGVKYVSAHWDVAALDVRLAALYPNLVKLSHAAGEEWEKDKTEAIYGDLRKNGWLKAHRLTPHSTPTQK